ncbi:(2Fe-2S)-binding protein [Spirillospora sp. NPDC050679]
MRTEPARAAGADTAEVLREVAALGPFFALSTDPAEAADPTWRPLPETDLGHLRAMAGRYAERLGTGELRVGASILFQGLAARVWSPAVAAAALGVVPDLSTLHWRWVPGASISLWLAEPAGWRTEGRPDDRAMLLHRTVVDGHLRPLREAMRSVARLADGLMWGNAASALAGTVHAGTGSPALAAPVRAVIDDLLAREPLLGTGSFGPAGFVRRSCCLYYRVPPGGEMCGDCGLRKP